MIDESIKRQIRAKDEAYKKVLDNLDTKYKKIKEKFWPGEEPISSTMERIDSLRTLSIEFGDTETIKTLDILENGIVRLAEYLDEMRDISEKRRLAMWEIIGMSDTEKQQEQEHIEKTFKSPVKW